MTPFYDRNGITIYCGECAQVMRDIIPDNHIDLTVTSPPYDNLRSYNGYVFDFEAIAGQLWRVTMTGGVVVWVVADQTVNGSETGTSFRQALYFMGLGFNLHDTMIYQSDKPPINHKRYQQKFEFMFIFCKGNIKTFNPIKIPIKHHRSYLRLNRTASDSESSKAMRPTDKRRYTISDNKTSGNCWYYATNEFSGDKFSYQHPAPFPEALARDHIISWSNPSDLVLDPMAGSGTTLKMAQMLGRRAIGIEISESYCQIAVERLRQPSFFSLPEFNGKQPKPEQLELMT